MLATYLVHRTEPDGVSFALGLGCHQLGLQGVPQTDRQAARQGREVNRLHFHRTHTSAHICLPVSSTVHACSQHKHLAAGPGSPAAHCSPPPALHSWPQRPADPVAGMGAKQTTADTQGCVSTSVSACVWGRHGAKRTATPTQHNPAKAVQLATYIPQLGHLRLLLPDLCRCLKQQRHELLCTTMPVVSRERFVSSTDCVLSRWCVWACCHRQGHHHNRHTMATTVSGSWRAAAAWQNASWCCCCACRLQCCSGHMMLCSRRI